MENLMINANVENLFNSKLDAELVKDLEFTLLRTLWRAFHENHRKGEKYLTRNNLDKYGVLLNPTIVKAMSQETRDKFKTFVDIDVPVKEHYPTVSDGWVMYMSTKSDQVVILKIIVGSIQEMYTI